MTVNQIEPSYSSKSDVEQRMTMLVRSERQITNEILHLINVADQRRLYLPEYTSTFEWLVNKFKYSEGAANRRLSAARLLRSVPEGTDKLVSGELNLTTLAKTHAAIRAQEKATGTKFTNEDKAQVVQAVENKSTNAAVQTLLGMLPEAGLDLQHDRHRPISEDTTRVSGNFSNETLAALERIKDLLSHTFPEGKLDKIINHIAQDYLNRHDPLRKESQKPKTACTPDKANARASAAPTATASKRCVRKPVSQPVRRIIFKRSQGKCEFKDAHGKVCGSTFQVQIDHIVPLALGGTNEPTNLRCLCRVHNVFEAERNLGGLWANSWRSNPRKQI